jgi:hypothetical protein
MSVEVELRTCPFCGYMPYVEHYRDGDWEISCIADTCPANPGVYGKTKLDASLLWNQRLAECDKRHGRPVITPEMASQMNNPLGADKEL